jgi:undecaprenyl-diphosphatase
MRVLPLRHSAVGLERLQPLWAKVRNYDEAVLLRLRRWHSPAVTRLMCTVTRLGDSATWTWLGIVLLVLGGEARHAGRLLAASALLATAITQILKRLSRRPRPSLGCAGFVALVEDPDRFSFPSGHTAAAFAVAVAYAGAMGTLAPWFLAFALLVAASRVYLGAHYPLDVAAGAVLGAASGALALVWLS